MMEVMHDHRRPHQSSGAGPTPETDADLTWHWLNSRDAWDAIRPWADNTTGEFVKMSDTERRMFLLFVACALENP